MGGKWWTLIVAKKRISGAHIDHGRRPPVSPIKSIKSKLWKTACAWNCELFPTPGEIAQETRLQAFALPYWCFSWSHGIPCPWSPLLSHGFAPASWLPGEPNYGNCILIHRDFLKIRAACGTWNCSHGDFIRSNNSIWCYRNLILMIISICNSPSSSKCLHWREISMEKVNLFKNVNFFVGESNEMPNCLCHYVALPSWALTALISMTFSHVAMQMGKFTSWWRPLICPFISSV